MSFGIDKINSQVCRHNLGVEIFPSADDVILPGFIAQNRPNSAKLLIDVYFNAQSSDQNFISGLNLGENFFRLFTLVFRAGNEQIRQQTDFPALIRRYTFSPHLLL